MPKKNVKDIRIPTYDDLFTTEEMRQDAKLERIQKIPISQIHDFKDHPFRVVLDDDMKNLIDSIKENGILMPAIVRPDKDGNGYEMISGHRRKFALGQLGVSEIDAVVRDIDDDQAIILMVDCNIQREHILPTEKGYAFRMKMEALKHQGARNDLPSSQVGTKGVRSDQIVAKEAGESRNQVQRYIRLTYLIQPLQEMVDGTYVDDIRIALNPAYELSFLKQEEQKQVAQIIGVHFQTPSLGQAQALKKMSQEGKWDYEVMSSMITQEKPNQKAKISIQMSEIDRYFPRSYTPGQKKEVILKLLGRWAKQKEQEQR